MSSLMLALRHFSIRMRMTAAIFVVLGLFALVALAALSGGRTLSSLNHDFMTNSVKELRNITEIRATYDPATRGGDSPDGRKVKATIHWVSANHAIPAEVRLYNHLCQIEDLSQVPDGEDWKSTLNPHSVEVLPEAQLEPSLSAFQDGRPVQFERLGYFIADSRDTQPGHLVFNRSVTLKDAWAKSQKK